MALFRHKPKPSDPVQCPCGERMTRGEISEHLHTHLVSVVADNGKPAFAFDCPLCGLSSQAWGHDTDTYDHKLIRASANLSLHFKRSHHVDF